MISGRNIFLALLLATFLSLAAADYAAAGVYTTGGSTGSDPSCVGSCSSGSIGGSAIWYELSGTNSRFPNKGKIPESLRWGKDIRGDTHKFNEAFTRYLMRPCSRGQRKGCILWKEKRKTSPMCYGNCQTWWELHSKRIYDAASGSAANTGGGFNVRVWRENTRTNKMELVFERRVGAACKGGNCNNADTDRKNYSGQVEANKYWWFGSPGSIKSTRGENPGGEYWEDGDRAGPIGEWYQKQSQPCLARFKKRFNDGKVNAFIPLVGGVLAIPHDGQPGKVVKNSKIRERSQDGREMGRGHYKHFCYWGAGNLSPRFTWNNSGSAIAKSLGRNSYKGPLANDEWGARMTPANKKVTLPGGKKVRVSRNLGGVLGTGTKEAIGISWSRPDKGNNRLKIEIRGAPGLAYATHITRVDNREKIMPMISRLGWGGRDRDDVRNTFWLGWCERSQRAACSGNKRSASRNSAQIFRAFIDNPIPVKCNVNCEDEPRGYDSNRSGPQVDVALNTDPSVSVLEPSKQTLAYDVRSSEVDQPMAVFPFGASISHFTPQMDHNNDQLAESETYSSKHAAYSEPGFVEKARSDQVLTDPRRRPEKNKNVQLQVKSFDGSISDLTILKEERPIAIKDSDYGVGTGAQYSMSTTWNNPTLNNPCDSQDPMHDPDPELGLSWPESPRLIGDPPADKDGTGCGELYNVWDELFYGTFRWQSIWESGIYDTSKDWSESINRKELRPLRCSALEVGAPRPLDGCSNALSYRPESSITGIINQSVTSPDDSPEERTRLRAVLRGGASSSRGVSANVLPLSGGSSLSVTDTYNSLTKQNEINFCRQGMPSGAKIAGGGSIRLADHYCQGYVLKWKWETSRSKGQCAAGNPRGTPVPTLERLGSTNSYARYIYNTMGSYRQAGLVSGAVQGDPYVGLLPRQRESWVKCRTPAKKPQRYWQTGSWTVERVDSESSAGFGKNWDGGRIEIADRRTALISFSLSSGAQRMGIDASWSGPNAKLFYQNQEESDRAPVQVLAPAPTR